MKKIMAVALVLVMMFAFTLSVAALSSPQLPTTPTSPSTPSSSTSPKTGDPLLFVAGLSVLALGLGAFAVKKIKE